MSEMNLVEAVRNGLHVEMGRDEDVIVYGEDVGVDGGVFRATKGLIDDYPDQVYDSPLAESGIIGTAVGMSAYGLKPVPEIQFSGFVYQGFHQLKQHLTRLRSRSRSAYSCQATIRTPYGGGIQALEHHSESFEAGYAHVPGLKVVIPSNPADTKGLLASSIRDPDPVLFMEPKQIYRAFSEEVPEGEHTVPLGEAEVVEDGEDVTVISWGAMLRDVKGAVKGMDVDAEVIDLRTISPLDTETIIDSVKRTGKAVIVQEAPRTGGMSSEITARINDEALLHLEAPVQRVTGYDVPYPMLAREDAYMPGEKRIRKGIEDAVNF
ncbi:MAG: alpha-ketoacid dehydrogenase subunit beta [Candidatus Nanohaloarchaeota archaeon QJJ-7]|nr:alpha-ketoacid dehydrogenase subunit beta [Candidatus Nanohaloarchaeota archaeon QJJ-7]